MPASSPRRLAGITLAITKLKLTACMPQKKPNSARNTHTATSAAAPSSRKPDRASPSTWARISQPTPKTTGITRLRCSISVALQIDDKAMPSDWPARARPTVRFDCESR